jgi:recombination DNA repair RAD52 pathway protein
MLGFDQWSSEIVVRRCESLEEIPEGYKGALFTLRYPLTFATGSFAAIVRVTFRDGRFIEGIGRATDQRRDRMEVLEQGQKVACTDALKSWYA